MALSPVRTPAHNHSIGILNYYLLPIGSITITNVELLWTGALGFSADKTFHPLGAFNTLLLPAIQLEFVNFYLGIAQGALAKAAQYTVKNTRGWPFSGEGHVKPRGVDEFYVQEIYGTLQAKVWGLEAQVDSVGEILGELIDREDRESVTAEERGNVSARVAAAKVTSTEIGEPSRHPYYIFHFV